MRWNPNGTILARDRATGTQRVYVSQEILDDPAHDLERVPEDEYDEPLGPDLDGLTHAELKDTARALGVKTAGSSQALADAIAAAATPPDPDDPSGDAADPTGA